MSFLKGLFHKSDGSVTAFGKIANAATGVVGAGSFINDRSAGSTQPVPVQVVDSSGKAVSPGSAPTTGFGSVGSTIGNLIEDITHPQVSVAVQDSQFNFIKIALLALLGITVYKLFKK